MSDESDTARTVPALVNDAETFSTLDVHGHDLKDYDWIPVRRQRRPDGWTRDKQRLFIATLADTGSVRQAAREVHMSPKSAYALRRAPDGAGFAAAWEAAIRQSMHRLLDEVTERAMNGVEEPIFNRDGQVISHKVRFNERLAMFLLRAHMPERFRLAHREDRAPAEPLPAPATPVEDALKLLDPVTPPDPHLLMPPGELETRLLCADILPGQLPRWYRDPDLEPAPPPDPYPLGEEFERQLEAAKNGTWSPPKKPRKKRV